jgi:hypothetical protein
MAALPTELTIQGKTLPVFTEKNLESMNPKNLRDRGLDLKDMLASVGAQNVQMPRHQEALRDWILQTQNSLLGVSGGPGAPQQPPSPAPNRGFMDQMRPSPESRGGGGGYAQSDAAMTDDQEAYMAARAGAMASRQRNQGSTNIISWG